MSLRQTITKKDFNRLIKGLNFWGYGNYKEFLDSDLWKHFRKEYLERNYKCYVCGGIATILHHCKYTDLYSTINMVAVCRSCHKKIHELVIERNVGVELVTRRLKNKTIY